MESTTTYGAQFEFISGDFLSLLPNQTFIVVLLNVNMQYMTTLDQFLTGYNQKLAKNDR
jgi:hypothetical protein